MRSPAQELAAVTAILKAQDIPHALIGGWAVVVWGYLRGSDDLDLLIELPASRRACLLEAMSGSWNAEWVAGGEDDPIPGLIRAVPKSGGLPVDLLPARGGSDRQALSRALTVALEDVSVPVVTPEDLIAMKLEAGGGQDYEDARRLLSILGERLDAGRLHACCEARRVSERLKLVREQPS